MWSPTFLFIVVIIHKMFLFFTTILDMLIAVLCNWLYSLMGSHSFLLICILIYDQVVIRLLKVAYGAMHLDKQKSFPSWGKVVNSFFGGIYILVNTQFGTSTKDYMHVRCTGPQMRSYSDSLSTILQDRAFGWAPFLHCLYISLLYCTLKQSYHIRHECHWWSKDSCIDGS